MPEQITIAVESALLVKAEQRAAAENTTLEDLLSSWLKRYADGTQWDGPYEELMARLDHVEAGNHFSCDDMNERR